MLTTSANKVIEYGDSVIIYSLHMGRVSYNLLVMEEKQIFDCFHGHFPHSKIVGLKYGSKCVGNQGFVHILLPTPELWTLALQHRTEILYCNDISLIVIHLELKPGMIVVESGTGSGSLSTAFARTVAPSGKLFTFEFHKERAEAAKVDFKNNGLEDIITVTHADACSEGFILEGMEPLYADAVFLDLPSPWLAIEQVKKCLKPNKMICSFSPCIEQTQRMCLALEAGGIFYDIITYETICRPMRVTRLGMHDDDYEDEHNDNSDDEGGERKKKQKQQKPKGLKKKRDYDFDNEPELNLNDYVTSPVATVRGHTGFLTFARKSLHPI
jgi:tRNA (adenine57-N1/adenine58-N1)-methyltransferase